MVIILLIDLLKTLSQETLIGIWNIDDRQSRQPTPQTYQKVKNIQWGKIQNIVDYEVLAINVIKQNSGVLVRVYNKDKLEMSICNSDLANKVRKG